MGAFDTRELLQAASASLAEGPAGPAPGRRRAVPIAEGVAEISMQPSYSPVLLVGMVRGVEFVLVTLRIPRPRLLSGQQSSVPLGLRDRRRRLGGLTVAVFQASGAYGVGAFRAFFNFGVRIVAGWLLVFLVALAAAFFLKIGDNFSRVWLASCSRSASGRSWPNGWPFRSSCRASREAAASTAAPRSSAAARRRKP